ncbi:hypothetical protein MD537_02815 [Flavihumibacter sediminis]|nr:hypothetical protein [Flavihumibacter sediminis]
MMDGFYVPGTDKVSIASVVDREPIAIIGNSLVYRVGAGTFLGLGKITKPSQLYEAYAGREPAQDPLLISLPTDGLYAQTIMDECLALEEHQGTVDWVLNDPDPELGVIDPSLLSTRRADIGSTLSPTPMPSTIINLQNAPDAPAPSGLQGAFNAVGNAAAFRDMAGLAGTQANAAAALTTAANLATNFGNQAAALKTAELATKVKATEDANKKLAAVQKAKAQDLITKDEASEHANKILSDMHTTAGSEENSGTLENIAQQLMDNGQEGSVGESISSGFRVIDIKAPEFQSSGSSTTTPIVLNNNTGQATNGRAAIFNFGTFVETNRFKTAAKQSDFVDTDVWFNANPGSLMNSNGVRLIQDSGVDPVFSFYHINNAVWKSRLNLGQKYTDAFDTWLSAALQDDIDCIYLTGHHWTDGNNFYLSSGHSQSQFSLSGKKGTGTLDIGRGSSVVKFPVTALKNQCKLIFGYGCDVATPHASKLYQDIFGRGAGDVPVICGWDATISVPDRDQASISPNNLYFEFLKNFADANAAPATNRLQWIYDNHPMELVNAWGHATRSWHKHSARARGKDGKLFKFTHSGGTVTAVHIP